jgi:MoxR-like ATPase
MSAQTVAEAQAIPGQRPSATGLALALVNAVETVVHGRRAAVELVIGTVLAGGHVLVEDVPGSGKTTLARAVARVLGGDFRRIQGTADLMPADIVGSSVWQPDAGAFRFLPGPVFGHVVLVDELNRTPPRTQSALLEAMEESAVTVDGVRHRLPDPFVLLATQNPHDQYGTYPLPEGQLDRFMLLVTLGTNDAATERRVLREQLAGATVQDLAPVTTPAQIVQLRRHTRSIHVADPVIGYATALGAATRTHPDVSLGASTRATLALVRCAQARAVLAGRSHVLPDDVKTLAVPALAHRLVLKRPDEDRSQARRVAAEVVAATPVPLAGA